MPRHLNGSKKNPSSGATSKSKAPGDSQGSPNHTTNHSYVEKKYRKIFTKLFAKYDKEFPDDDVIDLDTMEVIPGNDLSGQVRTEGPLCPKFGTLSTCDFRHLAEEDDDNSDCSGPSKPRGRIDKQAMVDDWVNSLPGDVTILLEASLAGRNDDDTSDAESLGSCSSDDEDHESSDNSSTIICNNDTNTGEHHSQHNASSNSEHIKLPSSTEEDDSSSTPENETVDLPSSAVQHVPQRNPEQDGSDAESLGDDKWSRVQTPESPLPHVNTGWENGESDNELEVILLEEITPEWGDIKESTSATKSKLSKRIGSKGRRFSTNSSMNSTTTSSAVINSATTSSAVMNSTTTSSAVMNSATTSGAVINSTTTSSAVINSTTTSSSVNNSTTSSCAITARNMMREDNNNQSDIKGHNVTCHDTSTLDCVVLLHDVSASRPPRSCNETVVHAPSSTHVSRLAHNTETQRPELESTSISASSSRTGAQHVVEQTLHNASPSRSGVKRVVESTSHNVSSSRSNAHPVVQLTTHNVSFSRSRAQHVVEETSHNASSSRSGGQHVTGQTMHNPSSSRSILNNSNNNAEPVEQTTSCNISSRRSGVEAMVQQISHSTLSSISGIPPVAAQRIDGNVLLKGPPESRPSSNRHQETVVITPKSVQTRPTACVTEALVISKDNLRQCSVSEVLDILLSPRALVIDGENVAERLERLRAAMIDPQEQSHAVSRAHTTICQPIREQEMIAPLIRDMEKRSTIPSKADGSSTPSKQYKPILDITDLSCIARSNSPTNSDDSSEDSPDGLNLDPTITSPGNLQCDITSNDSQTRRTVLTPKRSRAANHNRTYTCASAPLTNQNTTFTVAPVPVTNQKNQSPVDAHNEQHRNLHRAKLHNATFCVTTPPNRNNQLKQTQPLTSVPGGQHVSDVNNNQTTLFTSMDSASDEELDLVSASSFASLNNSASVGNLTLNDFLPRNPKRKQHDRHERPRERKQHERHRHKRSKLSTSDSASETPKLPIPSTGSNFLVFRKKNK